MKRRTKLLREHDLKIVKYRPKLSFPCWIIYDFKVGVYRTTAELGSTYTWTNIKQAAARFRTKNLAIWVAEVYCKGWKDVAGRHAMLADRTVDIIYPNFREYHKQVFI